MYRQLIPPYCCLAFHCMDVPQFDAHLPTEGQLGGFQFLPVVNKVAVDIHVQRFV